MFLKIGVLKKNLGLKSCQLHLWSTFLRNTCETVDFLYSITAFTKQNELLCNFAWRIFITVFGTAVCENTYWLIPYMYSYVWCSFWFVTIWFIKKCQNYQRKSVIFSWVVKGPRLQNTSHIYVYSSAANKGWSVVNYCQSLVFGLWFLLSIFIK